MAKIFATALGPNNGKLKIGAHVADEIGRFLTGGALVSEITQAMLATIA